MFIQITERVANNPRWFPLVDVIVGALERSGNPHSIDPSYLPMLQNSAWIRDDNDPTGIRKTNFQLISQTAKARTRASSSDAVNLLIDDTIHGIGETNFDSKQISCSPYEALTLLLYPFSLIVENDISDGAFLLWVARALGQTQFTEAYRYGRLVFRSAGGKGEIAKSAQALSFGVWPAEGRPIAPMSLRTAAMLDNDSRYPGENKNTPLLEQISRHVAFTHILKARTIENYVHPTLMRRRLNQDNLGRMADAFSRLNELQRSHFPMKEGFMNRDISQAYKRDDFYSDQSRPAQERQLYADVNEADWDVLAVGFGKRLASVFQDPQYRCNPNDKTQIPQEHVDELRELVELIVRYL